MSSSSSDYNPQYDPGGEPNKSNFIGNGSMPFGSDTYEDYRVRIGGEDRIQRRWKSGQIHERPADGSGGWTRKR